MKDEVEFGSLLATWREVLRALEQEDFHADLDAQPEERAHLSGQTEMLRRVLRDIDAVS